MHKDEPLRPWRPTPGRLVAREASTLGGKVYVLHTYSNGARWAIIQHDTMIRATRIAPGGRVSDAGHEFRRPLGSDRTLPSGAQGEEEK